MSPGLDASGIFFVCVLASVFCLASSGDILQEWERGAAGIAVLLRRGPEPRGRDGAHTRVSCARGR